MDYYDYWPKKLNKVQYILLKWHLKSQNWCYNAFSLCPTALLP